MSSFDSILHSMTTIATGGYSTKSGSIGAFNSQLIDWIILLGMIFGSLPFVHYLAMTKGSYRDLIKDSQVRWFLVLLTIIILTIFSLLFLNGTYDLKDSIRYSAFNVTSILTGTGYGTADFGLWGGFAPTILLLCMFIGGCAGSTTCGIRMFRIQVLASSANAQLIRLLRPHSIVLPHYNEKPVPDNVTNAVMGFFFIYILAFAITASALSILGLDFETSISGAASAISNVGPGLGEQIGPSGNFSTLPFLAKWILCAAMILGRLELYTILILFTPNFWKY
jgi:trk system potassium uptake protein TrkH